MTDLLTLLRDRMKLEALTIAEEQAQHRHRRTREEMMAQGALFALADVAAQLSDRSATEEIGWILQALHDETAHPGEPPVAPRIVEG